MMRSRPGGTKRTREAAPDERIDVAAVIAQALNRPPAAAALPDPAPASAPPEPEAVLLLDPPQAEPEPAAPEPVLLLDPPQAEPEPAAPEPAAEGMVVSIRLDAPPDGDPLAAVLVAIGKSLTYDATTSGIAWDQIVVELPPGEPALTSTGAGPARSAFRASVHSRGLVERFRCELEELDPATGYDVLVRRKLVLLCRWPQRARDVNEATLAGSAASVPPSPQHSGQRGGRFRRRRHRDERD